MSSKEKEEEGPRNKPNLYKPSLCAAGRNESLSGGGEIDIGNSLIWKKVKSEKKSSPETNAIFVFR